MIFYFLKHLWFFSQLPSVVAAAVFYCARRAFDLTPPWPDRLTEATGGITPEIQDVAFCADRLFKEYQTRDNEVR